jgi:hypothetical protein
MSGGTLVPPAVAKWHFVEEKARGVLDAFCHREVRLPPAATPAHDAGVEAALAAAFVAHRLWQSDRVTRWYTMGPLPGPAGGGSPLHAITAAVFVAADVPLARDPSLDAELFALGAMLLREAGLPERAIRVALSPKTSGLTEVDAVKAILNALGETAVVAPAPFAREATAQLVFATAGAEHVLGSSFRDDSLVATRGGPATVLVALTLDLGAIIAALSDDDAGYQPAISLVIAPLTEGARRAGLVVAHGLRAGGIRAELAPTGLDFEAQRTRASALGARLMLLMDDEEPAGDHQLFDLATGQRHEVAPDELEVRVAQLLD